MFKVNEILTRILDDNFYEHKECIACFENEKDAEIYIRICYEKLYKCSALYNKAKEHWNVYKNEIFKLKLQNSYLNEWDLRKKLRSYNVEFFNNNPPDSSICNFFDYGYYTSLISWFTDKRNLDLKNYFSYEIENSEEESFITDDAIFDQFKII